MEGRLFIGLKQKTGVADFVALIKVDGSAMAEKLEAQVRQDGFCSFNGKDDHQHIPPRLITDAAVYRVAQG